MSLTDLVKQEKKLRHDIEYSLSMCIIRAIVRKELGWDNELGEPYIGGDNNDRFCVNIHNPNYHPCSKRKRQPFAMSEMAFPFNAIDNTDVEEILKIVKENTDWLKESKNW